MKICNKCLLSDNIQSVRIGSDGLCNYCSDQREKREAYPEADFQFAEMLDMHRDKKYQVLMAYSGGKDSTYTLKLIKEKYNASILAVTFNNGFMSEGCFRNINAVTDYLGVDSVIVKYPVDKMIKAFKFAENGSIFPRTSLERASSICNLCIMLIKNLLYYEAILRDIPIICFGWTPGQVETRKPLIKLDYRMVFKMFNKVGNAIAREFDRDYSNYFLDESFLEEHKDRMPALYYPFVKNAYDEASILGEIEKIGWKLPENTDGNSSNCLLNSYANQSHIDRFGYHPYAFEISNLIRQGYMTKEEGTAKLEKVKNDSSFELVRKKFQAT